MTATLTPEDHEALTASLATALKAARESEAEDSAILAAVAAKAKNIRTIVASTVALVGFVSAGTLAVHELQQKPSREQVQTDIENHNEAAAHPVASAAIEANAKTAAEIQADVETVKRVQDYQIEQAVWQGSVLQHVAERKRSRPPAKPESLIRKERELLSR
ncbi:MAG: hypothetical protein KAI80_01665 [Hyphomicrobiaceae bacterium]|nr:hypothetical protein [Hyphomicrobiaceae bacterium]